MNTSKPSRPISLRWILLTLVVGGVAAILLACGLGEVPISPRNQLSILSHAIRGIPNPDVDATLEQIYLHIRLPRVFTGYFVGVGLACVGALFQSLLRNPLAEPYILGVSPGASLGATLFVVLAHGSAAGASFGYLSGMTIFAFSGGILAVIAAYLLASQGRYLSLTDILLAGIAIGAVCAAVTSYLWMKALSNVPGLLYWLMGNLSGKEWNHVLLLAVLTVPAVVLCWKLAPALNLILLGEEHATFLGLNVERFKKWLLVLGTLAAAGTVAVSGVIGFVGIIVPHTVRRFVGANNERLIPASSLAGGMFLVLCDLLARTLFVPAGLPVGMLTAFIGAPFFLVILRRSKQR